MPRVPHKRFHRTAEIFGVLKDREIRAMWMAAWISDAGSYVTFVALAVYIHSLTQEVAAVGFALALRSISGFTFGPFAGVVADRLDRRRVMIVCDLARAALVALLPLTRTVWMAYAVAFASGLFAPLFRAARTALLPDVAPGPKLVPALTVSTTTHHVLHTVGPAFGGLVVLLAGARNGFFVDAASFVVSAAYLARVRSRGRPEPSGESPLKDFAGGVRALLHAPAVRTYSLINAVLAMTGAGIVALLVVYVRDVLDRGGGEFGLVLAAAGIGTVAVSIFVAVRDDTHSRTPWVFVSTFATGVFAFAFMRPSFVPLLLLAFILGMADGGIDIPESATAAETLAPSFRGRVAAATEAFGEVAFAAGSIGFAWLGDPARVGVSAAMATASIVGVALCLVILLAGGARAVAASERQRLAAVAPAAV